MNSNRVLLSLAFGAFITTMYLVGYGIGAIVGNAICEVKYNKEH